MKLSYVYSAMYGERLETLEGKMWSFFENWFPESSSQEQSFAFWCIFGHSHCVQQKQCMHLS